MAGFYFKSNEDYENHEVPQSEAPVAGIDEDFAACLKSATVVALIEDYLRCGQKHGKFESGEQMIEVAKTICSQALDNGDMTSEDCKHVLEWAEKNRLAKKECDCFAMHVLGEELNEVVGNDAAGAGVPEDLVHAYGMYQSGEALLKQAIAKYGEIINKYAWDFLRLSGKNFDEHFLTKFNVEGQADVSVPAE